MVRRGKAHLSVREKREVKKIASSVVLGKTEKKQYVQGKTNLQLQRAVTKQLIKPSDGLQATDDDSRIANRIQVQNLHFKGVFQPGSTLNNVVRVMIVQWMGRNSASALLDPPLNGFDPVNATGANTNWMLFKQRKSDSDAANLNQYRILYDKEIWYDATNANTQSPFELIIPGKKLHSKGVFEYSKGTTTVYDNPIVMYGFGIDAVVGDLAYTYKSTYTDI